MDILKIHSILGLIVVNCVCVLSQNSVPTECDRGVRRHHPSQANVYQVFTRKDFRKQWISYSCPEFKVFDPRACECVMGRKIPLEPPSGPDTGRSDHRTTDPQASPLVGRDLVNPRHPDPARTSRGHNQREKSQRSQTGSFGRREWHGEVIARSSQPPEAAVQSRDGSTELTSEVGAADDVTLREKAGHEPTCQLHRSTNDPALFERWSDGQWVAEDCNWPFYTGLVWRQDTCRCEWGPNRTLALPLTENGVPASCLMMLRVTFDNGEIRDEGRHIWLNVRHRDGAAVEKDSSAVGGFSGSFRGSSVVVPYFKSNVLGDVFHIGFSFKLCPGNPDTDIVLLHNDCPEAETGPSVVISYQAWSKQITVALRTINTDDLAQDTCNIQTPQDRWTKVDVRYGDSFLDISINDELCTQSDKHYGLVATNNCPLTLLGEAFCGHLDEVIITRGCTDAHAIS